MSKKPHRAVLSSRINSETGEREFFEISQEEADAAIKRFLDSLPPAKPITPEEIEEAAKRGADNARKFLACNPTQDDIQEAYEWTFEDARSVTTAPKALLTMKPIERYCAPT